MEDGEESGEDLIIISNGQVTEAGATYVNATLFADSIFMEVVETIEVTEIVDRV